MPAALEGFERFPFTHEGKTRSVFRVGTGPAVVVIAEIPGITPQVAGFARQVADRGLSAWLPNLFGEPGAPPSSRQLAKVVPAVCVSREFSAWAAGRTSPVTGWLRALAAFAHDESGGPGVGAVGMCFTGGFALGMMVDDRMVAPVLCQPSLPLTLTRRHRAAVGLSPADLDRVKQRAADGVCVLGLRFSNDRLSPPERFETLRRELGDAFIGVEIDSGPNNPSGLKESAHSVVTHEAVKVAHDSDHPVSQALQQVLDFLVDRLLVNDEV